ncbi:MAG: helix-turn-helix transcriptional regulator [Fibrobacterota bacterium]|nr:helix-turn-helix transcriptional regulator [Fibrobacterota bacterium]
MRSFNNYLKNQLKNPEFRQAYEDEARLTDLAVRIAKQRELQGMSQDDLAARARLTQQQVSKVEHAGAAGFNVNTLMKVCSALGLDVILQPRKSLAAAAGEKRAGKGSLAKLKRPAKGIARRGIKTVPKGPKQARS